MKEDNFDVNLIEMDEVFNNKTFKYRINGFAHACRMKNISVTKNNEVMFDTEESDNLDVIKSDDADYFIAVNKNEYSKGKTVTLTGQYEDLHFTFINYYNKENLDKRIIDLPFSIVLTKQVDQDTYKFEIETVEGARTKFAICKYRDFKDRTLYDDVVFYANVMDFSEILKLVKSFVFNPILVFNTYNEIDQKYKHVYTNHDLNKAIMQDESLDKPMSKIKKIWKRKMN